MPTFEFEFAKDMVEGEAHASRLAAFSDKRVTAVLDDVALTRKEVLTISDPPIPTLTLQNWLQRKQIELEGPRMSGGRRNFYTGQDAITICTMHRISHAGMPLRWLLPLSEFLQALAAKFFLDALNSDDGKEAWETPHDDHLLVLFPSDVNDFGIDGFYQCDEGTAIDVSNFPETAVIFRAGTFLDRIIRQLVDLSDQ